jgi:hypothetical protein
MSVLSPRRAAQIEADPPCITFGEVRRLIAASKVNDDLVAALKEASDSLWSGCDTAAARQRIADAIAKAQAQS